MTIWYAVPSHARAEKINGWALRALADAGVPKDRVAVFIDESQKDAYLRHIDQGLVGLVVRGGLGLGAQRRAIDRHFGDGSKVVQLDDDIRGIVRRVNERRLAPVTDLPTEASDAFALAEQVGARLWGVYPTLNAGWMKAKARTGLTFVCGGLFGHIVDQTCSVQLDQKEDYERTLRYFSADGTVLRIEWLGMRTSMYLPGGMQADDQPDRSALNEKSVAYLRATWPAHVRLAKRTGRAGAELRLVS